MYVYIYVCVHIFMNLCAYIAYVYVSVHINIFFVHLVDYAFLESRDINYLISVSLAVTTVPSKS